MAKKYKTLKKHNKPIIVYKTENVIAFIYAILMLAVFPLFYRNNYINITASKLGFFGFSTLITAIVLIVVLIGKLISGDSGTSKRVKEVPVKKETSSDETGKEKTFWGTILDKISIPDIFVIVFFLTLIISWIGTLFLNYPEYETGGETIFTSALRGSLGKQAGVYFFLALIVAYLIVSRLLIFNEWIVEAYLWTNMIVFGLAILNHFMIDPLNMYSNLVEEQYWMFISTMGNINVLAGYFCVFVPFAVGLYISSESIDEKISYIFFIIVAFMGIIAANADSAILGLGVAFIFQLWFAFESIKKLSRYFRAVAIFFVSAALLGYWDAHAEVVKEPLEQLPSLISNSAINRVGIVVCVIISGVLYYIEKKNPELKEKVTGKLELVRNCIFVILAVVVVSGLVVFIYLSTVGADLDLGAWSTYLRFTDEFGSSRGFTWKRTFILYKDYLNFFQKLFGFGPDLYRIPMHAMFDREVFAKMGAYLVDAHNEALEILITLGFVGFASWYGFIISSLYNIVKNRNCNLVLLPIAAGMVGYITESMMTSPQTFSTPVFMLMTALGLATVRFYQVKQD